MKEKPYKTIVSDADFIDIIKNNSIKLSNIKKAYIKPVSFEFTFLEKNPEIQTETEKCFKQYFPDIELLNSPIKAHYACLIEFKLKYTFIDKKISFFSHSMTVFDSRCPLIIHQASGENIVAVDKLPNMAPEVLCVHFEELKKEFT